MKKKQKSLHTLSSVARSVTMLGSCMMGIQASFSYQNQDDLYDVFMDVMDGSSGGSIAPIYGGTVAVSGLSASQSVTLSVTVTCPASQNHFGCVGSIFTGTGVIEAQVSYQNFCTGGVTATTSIGGLTCSTSGATYNINFSCVNFTTQRALNNSTTTASFVCTN